MSFIVLGTDTDVGKSTFSLLWLAAYSEYAYWKPLETGTSDHETIKSLTPRTIVFEPFARFTDPVAPPLAARREGRTIPSAAELARGLPDHPHLLIETFGSPFSPLNEHELQIELLRLLNLPSIVITRSTLGTIGRTLASLEALKVKGITPSAVVLMGDDDDYATEQIQRHSQLPSIHLVPPRVWNIEGIREAAVTQADRLDGVGKALFRSSAIVTDTSEWVERDRSAVWHPYTSLRSADKPICVVGARDEFFHLADGRQIIDGISSWWTILHGHRDPRLMAALHEATQSYDHVLFAGVTHPPAVRVAELLLQTLTSDSTNTTRDGRVFFSDNGSTAVEVALKMAYQFWHQRGEPHRTLFIGFENGYHGDTFGAMAVGRDPLFFGRFEPLLFQVERLPVDANRLEVVLQQNAGRVAAVIIEPLVQGAGGMQMHTPAELRAIFEVTQRHEVLFIADEVMTGCYRTGTMWAFQAAGITPDLICTAKTLAGGVLSLAATLASPAIVAAFDDAAPQRTFFHGHSFTAHPLACAVAATNLELLMREPPTAPARLEEFWERSLSPLRDHPLVEQIRIQGTIAAIEMHAEGGYLAGVGRTLHQRCLDRGVFLRPLGNVLYAMPPFGTSQTSLERIARVITDVLAMPI